MITFPIDTILPNLRVALASHTNVVLSAQPGAGKTTRVPPSLLNEPWLSGKKILMLEPRRLATQRSAVYMASQINENVGETIGYTMRGDRKVGRNTKIEVVTEGILTRMLQDTPDLPNVGIIIFDEFHERSIHADLGLAFALDVQKHLRPDLRILVMSATLDGVAISALLGGSPVIESEGKIFPVLTHYLNQKSELFIEQQVTSIIVRALKDSEGDILVFLPGQREIRRTETILLEKYKLDDVIVHTLFGEASPKHQQAALSQAPDGKRKVILSTSIAETSLTIDGVRIVVDSGLSRIPMFDPKRGMSGLVTVPVSKASADQRRGRAGRQAPGVCYRIWTEEQHENLPNYLPPEILSADLAPVALELSRWGSPDGKSLSFLDPPPEHHLQQAVTLLEELGAMDSKGNLNKHGNAMADLPVHPRLAHMLIKGKEFQLGAMACDVAALLEERDLLRGTNDADIDLFSRWHALRKHDSRDRFAKERVEAQALRLRQMLNVTDRNMKEEKLGLLLALAYPERVAKRREASGERYQMAGGTGAVLPKSSMLSREEYLAIGDVDGAGSEVKVFLAAPITEDDIRMAFNERIIDSEEVYWDERAKMVVAQKITRLEALELSKTHLKASGELVVKALIQGIRQEGLHVLPWSKDATSMIERCTWLSKQNFLPDDYPKTDADTLLATLEEWLMPYCSGITRLSQLDRLDMSSIVRGMFSYKQLQELDALAPTHLVVPTGSNIPLDYSVGEQPVLAVRLQEMFGETQTPTVAGGRVKVLLHLLSPAHRPLAVTQDLPSFWNNAYPDVRKDMRGRYPKHYWPENPLEAEPTRRAKPRGT